MLVLFVGWAYFGTIITAKIAAGSLCAFTGMVLYGFTSTPTRTLKSRQEDVVDSLRSNQLELANLEQAPAAHQHA